MLVATLLITTAGSALAGPVGATNDFASEAFSRVWSRTDAPVRDETVSRTWFWGPKPDTPATDERYLDAPGNERLVQYFDKGRMEINDPNGDPSNPWYVTSGLLDRELISGRIQIGTNTFLDTGAGAKVPIAGDPDNTFPTYNDFQRIVDQGQPDQTGQYATTVLLSDRTATRPQARDDSGAQYAHYVSYTGPCGVTVGYNIPRAFWEFMTSSGIVQDAGGQVTTADPLFDWLFVMGYPIADPVWAQVKLQGATQWVLIQPFERRVLTYTPSNPDGWQVELGNIGQHYYRWRYATTPPVTINGDQGYLGMVPGYKWVYGTSDGVDETWQVTGVSYSFAGGSHLLARQEDSAAGHRVTYWGVTSAGLDLYGFDQVDGSGNIKNMTVYWPPVHYLPNNDPYIGESWSTETTAISSNGPPQTLTVSVQVEAYQSVSTPAGIGRAWKLFIVEWSGTDTIHPNQTDTTLWFAPTVGVMQWFTSGFTAQLKVADLQPQ